MIERIINVLDSKIIKINLPNFINVVITTISMIILKKFTLAIYPKDKKKHSQCPNRQFTNASSNGLKTFFSTA